MKPRVPWLEGTLEPGKVADLVETESVLTLAGGRIVYDAGVL
jgi:hypothetical protein